MSATFRSRMTGSSCTLPGDALQHPRALRREPITGEVLDAQVGLVPELRQVTCPNLDDDAEPMGSRIRGTD
jgi:hypothetical protein